MDRNLALTPVQLHVRQCKQGYRQGQCSRTRLAVIFAQRRAGGGEQASRAKKQRRIATRILSWLV